MRVLGAPRSIYNLKDNTDQQRNYWVVNVDFIKALLLYFNLSFWLNAISHVCSPQGAASCGHSRGSGPGWLLSRSPTDNAECQEGMCWVTPAAITHPFKCFYSFFLLLPFPLSWLSGMNSRLSMTSKNRHCAFRNPKLGAKTVIWRLWPGSSSSECPLPSYMQSSFSQIPFKLKTCLHPWPFLDIKW